MQALKALAGTFRASHDAAASQQTFCSLVCVVNFGRAATTLTGHVQGRTGQLDKLPRGLWKGPHVSLSRSSTTLFMGPVDRTTLLWCLSYKAPETRAAELRSLFEDPTAVQVGSCSSIKPHLQWSRILICQPSCLLNQGYQ